MEKKDDSHTQLCMLQRSRGNCQGTSPPRPGGDGPGRGWDTCSEGTREISLSPYSLPPTAMTKKKKKKFFGFVPCKRHYAGKLGKNVRALQSGLKAAVTLCCRFQEPCLYLTPTPRPCPSQGLGPRGPRKVGRGCRVPLMLCLQPSPLLIGSWPPR